MTDTGANAAARRYDGTVAYAEVDGRPIFGINSDAPGYTVADENAANDMRARLIERYPDLMATKNLGHMPNNALYHAEATALLRAAASGRYLGGQTIEMRVDRWLCGSCEAVLPKLAQAVGNPTVRIIDGKGDLWIMRDGIWIEGADGEKARVLSHVSGLRLAHARFPAAVLFGTTPVTWMVS